MTRINLCDEEVAMVADELEYQYRLRQAKKVDLGVILDIDRESIDKLSSKLASKGMRMVRENGFLYAIPVEK